MTQAVIDLGVVGEPVWRAKAPPPSIHGRRPALVAAVVLLCLLALGGSAIRRPLLGEPAWMADVSLNGFTLGSESVYLAAPSATTMYARDLATGRQRWSHDITDLPDTTIDVGNGVAAVLTRRLSTEVNSFYGRPNDTITFVSERTGEVIGQTSGTDVFPSSSGGPVLVFANRPRTPGLCEEQEFSCLDITGWDVTKGSTLWQLSVPAGGSAYVAATDGHVDALVEVTGETVRVRDPASAAILATATLSTVDTRAQVLPVRGALVFAQRNTDSIVLTALDMPSLRQRWSVTVPASDANRNGRFGGYFAATDCGTVVCLHVYPSGTRLVDVATGSLTGVQPPAVSEQLGNGVFVAVRSGFDSSGSDNSDGFDGSRRDEGVYVVSRANTVLAEFPHDVLVEWVDSGGRALLARRGPDRIGFSIVDSTGDARYIGNVAGTDLTCAARATSLACSNGAGLLRVWRLPL